MFHKKRVQLLPRRVDVAAEHNVVNNRYCSPLFLFFFVVFLMGRFSSRLRLGDPNAMLVLDWSIHHITPSFPC